MTITGQHPPIVAPASGGGGAVALLRLSGDGCHARLAKCLGGTPKGAWPERELRLAKIVDPKTRETIDEAMVVRFAAPRSYTGEDMAEVHCHGGPYVVRRVLETLYAAGFRPADPGEFTRRAFLNGKMDLTAAEGVRELVEAETKQQWQAARQLATGRLREAIDGLRSTLVEAMAHLEAQIDFPDEGDTAHLGLQHVDTRVGAVETAVTRLLGSYDSGRVASRGLMVALCGAPNAGKSTLLNELLGRERAIVTPIAGTTRDWIEERCVIDGRLVRLVDMAGLRETDDPVEQVGVASARRLAQEADLALILIPADDGEAGAAHAAQWVRELRPKAHELLLTKVDLARPAWATGVPAVSCQTKAGVPELKQRLARRVDELVRGIDTEEAYVTTARHATALREAQVALVRYREARQRHEFAELLAFELMEAARALRAIIGEVGTEDILDRVFAEFCIGK